MDDSRIRTHNSAELIKRRYQIHPLPPHRQPPPPHSKSVRSPPSCISVHAYSKVRVTQIQPLSVMISKRLVITYRTHVEVTFNNHSLSNNIFCTSFIWPTATQTPTLIGPNPKPGLRSRFSFHFFCHSFADSLALVSLSHLY